MVVGKDKMGEGKRRGEVEGMEGLRGWREGVREGEQEGRGNK